MTESEKLYITYIRLEIDGPWVEWRRDSDINSARLTASILTSNNTIHEIKLDTYELKPYESEMIKEGYKEKRSESFMQGLIEDTREVFGGEDF